MDTMRDAWDAGDVRQLALMANDSFGAAGPEIADRLLNHRNENWIPRIEALLLDPGTRMVVVGAAHLGGPNGVIALLEARGHTVTSVE